MRVHPKVDGHTEVLESLHLSVLNLIISTSFLLHELVLRDGRVLESSISCSPIAILRSLEEQFIV